MRAEETRIQILRMTRLVVKNLLRESDFSMEKIAAIANVSVDFVKKVKAKRRIVSVY
jgi:hypothetical protein